MTITQPELDAMRKRYKNFIPVVYFNANAAFITAARSDLPRLLDEVERLEDVAGELAVDRQRLRDILGSVKNHNAACEIGVKMALRAAINKGVKAAKEDDE